MNNNNTTLAQQAAGEAAVAATIHTTDQLVAQGTEKPAALPITHQSHPFWAGFSWPVALHTLQLLATVAPIVVAIADKKDPATVEEATQLSGLTGAIAGELLKSQSQQ